MTRHVDEFAEMLSYDNMLHIAKITKKDGSSVTGIIIDLVSRLDSEDGYATVDMCNPENKREGRSVSERDFLCADIGEKVDWESVKSGW